MPRTRSNFWSYFIKTKDGGQCKLCNTNVKSVGTTTNLKKHLERRHPRVLLKFNAQPEPGEPGPSTLMESEFEVPTIEIQPLVDVSNDNTKNVSPLSAVKGGHKANQITNAVIYMIAKDNLPLNRVENEGFRYFMGTVAPLYKPPSRKTISNLIDNKYDVLSGIIKIKLSVVSSVTLTTDVWTETMNTKSFLGITCHFYADNQLHSITIGVHELSERHTSDYLEECLRSVMTDWNISVENVTAVVTDNGTTYMLLMKAKNQKPKGKAFYIGLAFVELGSQKKEIGNTSVQNIIRVPGVTVASKIIDDVEEIKSVIIKIKAIVTYFKQSVLMADELRKVQPPENVLKLIQSVPTRWNSTFFMLERFVKLYHYIAPILLKNPKSPTMVNATDMELVEEVLQILAPIAQVSKEICGEKYLTSTCTHLINNINQQCRTGLIETDDSQNLQSHSNEQSSSSLWNFHETLAKDSLAMKNVASASNNSSTSFSLHIDLKIYLNQPTLPLNSNPLEYWNRGGSSPILQTIANKYLSVTGTSVPSERLFSKAGCIITQSRNRLTGNRLSKLLFLNSLDKFFTFYTVSPIPTANSYPVPSERQGLRRVLRRCEISEPTYIVENTGPLKSWSLDQDLKLVTRYNDILLITMSAPPPPPIKTWTIVKFIEGTIEAVPTQWIDEQQILERNCNRC
ncbi:hypothetical protein NQ315_008226 [Exocentrus adspersus]|uniref:BED-type domain-containing protein n=1 Tax=Exocentrus adspersus TaxID=1586481 RepID=A0AAV8VMR4_9CUCU|nr:hypothetical protein NQ315_008226 [Exocentrus adspersus]